ILKSFKYSNYRGGGGQNLSLNRYYAYFSSIFIAFLAFVFISFCFINFYYYELYHTKIDIFIFGLKDDNTQAILDIVFKDYPLGVLLLIALAFSAFCVWLNKKILNLNLPSVNLKFPVVLALLLIFLALYIVALRGHFSYVAMRAGNYRFSNLENFNALALNPLMSFNFALRDYKKDTLDLKPANMERLEELEKIFPLFATSPKNDFALANKPHIMVNLMESFGTQMLSLQGENLNLLGELAQHFEEDFVWTRFLPCQNGTASSFFCLFFQSPIVLSKSKYKKHYLPFSPIEVYKKQGYRVIFLTAGNLTWFDLGFFMKAQGVDEVIDEVTLLQDYPISSKIHYNPHYGVGDEFMYQKALELLSNTKEPLLILALSISNHPPYPEVPILFSKEQIPLEIFDKIPKNTSAILNTYVYANNEFARFLNKIKQSTLKDNTIIAATGDHRVRDLKIDFGTEKAFGFGVPFYLYISKPYQKDITYNKTRVGSHKDIFPTLYALTLSGVETLNLGGRNMLGKIESDKLEFAHNRSVWIDEQGIYPNDSTLGYPFADTESLLNSSKGFELDAWHLEFRKLYEELLDTQLRYRLINLQKH
ncbi:LTA synthase family protein, partial [Helicobacter rodentium]